MKKLCEECGKYFDETEMADSVRNFRLCQSCADASEKSLDFGLNQMEPEEKVVKKKITDMELKKAINTSRLIALITNLPVRGQEMLLKDLQNQKYSSQREHARKECQIEADYASEDRVYKDLIQNISINGLFIETREEIEVGQSMTLVLSLPDQKKPIKLNCTVVRIAPNGAGVRFDNISNELEKTLRSFIESL